MVDQSEIRNQNLKFANFRKMLIGRCRLPVLRRRLPVCLNRIKVENVSIISIRAASHDENVDHVTADSKKSPIAKWIVISSGLFCIFFLHQYANNLGEKTSAAASFHERYPGMTHYDPV